MLTNLPISAYRSLFRPQLDAAADIRQALQLGMPVGNNGRFAEAICARAGIRRNSGKRGRPVGGAKGGSFN